MNQCRIFTVGTKHEMARRVEADNNNTDTRKRDCLTFDTGGTGPMTASKEVKDQQEILHYYLTRRD